MPNCRLFEINPNDILSLCEIVIALCALFVSLYVTRKQNEFNENSVRPICVIINDCIGTKFNIVIQNAGSGPMLIDYVRYISKNDDIATNKKSKLRQLVDIFIFPKIRKEIRKLKCTKAPKGGIQLCVLNKEFECEKISELQMDGKAIAAGDKIEILVAEFNDEQSLKSFCKTISDVIIKVYYRDIYNNKFSESLDFGNEYEKYLEVLKTKQKRKI